MQHLLLLHGALGSKAQLASLASALQDHYTVHTLNFPGHGGRPFPEAPFSIPFFSEQVSTYMQEMGILQAHIFGYSMGGYAAMYLAKQYPDKVNKLITLATKFHWDEQTATQEAGMLDATIIQQKLPAFAAQLQERHAPNDWMALLDKTKQLLTGLGQHNALQLPDYRAVTTPVLLLLGDRDKMVTLEETVAVYQQLPTAQLGVLPNTPHAIEKAVVDALADTIRRFLG